MSSRRGQELVNGTTDLHWQTAARTEAQGSGRGSTATFHRGGSEMTIPSGQGQHPTAGNDQLLTAPRVSLSPVERVRFHTLLLFRKIGFNKVWLK